MLRKIMLGAAASLSALTVMPAAAEAQGYYRDGYYARNYDGYYREAPRRYNRGGYYAQRGRGYYAPRRYYRGRRCGSGTTGAVVGGAAGALVGREIARDGGRHRYRRSGDGTIGAILGGAVGALVGREVGRSC